MCTSPPEVSVVYAALRRLYAMPPGRVLLECAAAWGRPVNVPAGTLARSVFHGGRVRAYVCAYAPLMPIDYSAGKARRECFQGNSGL